MPRQRVDSQLERGPRIVRDRKAVRFGFVEACRFVEQGDGGMARQAAQLAADQVIPLHWGGYLPWTDQFGGRGAHDMKDGPGLLMIRYDALE
mmetsp:Transcript_15393/g.33479  ORF Transcript_15393/g.33479 Transcript_15393/m.33479 type:complete len:92 (+) Transcript_15393:1687-1962(+)